MFSTISRGIYPARAGFRNIAEVNAYLDDLIETIFLDPTCGDGLCEAPFEMASWGRFGCASDCGFLENVLDVDSIQVWRIFADLSATCVSW